MLSETADQEKQAETKRRLKKVYIAARRHSGTTFTDVLIGSAPRIESIGEVVTGITFRKDEPCSCGLPIEECPFWTSVVEIYQRNTGRSMFSDGEWLYWNSDIRKFWSVWFSSLAADSKWSEYISKNDDLLAAIQDHTDAEIILDSSKEFTRALLWMRGDPEALLIHMFRDPASIVGSHYYRVNKGMSFKFMKRRVNVERFGMIPVMVFVAFTWNVGMLLGCLLALRFGKRVMHLSYEELCKDPTQQINRIGKFIGADLSDVAAGVAEGREFPVGHNIGGNELRHEGAFKFVPNVKGRRKLPLHYRIISSIVSIPGKILQLLFVRTR